MAAPSTKERQLDIVGRTMEGRPTGCEVLLANNCTTSLIKPPDHWYQLIRLWIAQQGKDLVSSTTKLEGDRERVRVGRDGDWIYKLKDVRNKSTNQSVDFC